MEEILLREQEVFPSEKVLANALGDRIDVYNELIRLITETKLGLMPEWRYYNDGKAWLCKVCFKKKTVFWLSVWKEFIKIGFYFSEKNGLEVMELDISESIKEEFSKSKKIGKLIPLVINMTQKEQIDEIIKISEYKVRIK